MYFINLVVLLYVFCSVNSVASDNGSDQKQAEEDFQYLDLNYVNSEEMQYEEIEVDDPSKIPVTNSSNEDNDQNTIDYKHWILDRDYDEIQKENRDPVSEEKQDDDEVQDKNYDKNADLAETLFGGDKRKGGLNKQKYFLLPSPYAHNYENIDDEEDEQMPDREEADSYSRTDPIKKPNHSIPDYSDETTPLADNEFKSSMMPDPLPRVSDGTSSESWYQTTPDSRFDQNTDLIPDSSPLPESELQSSIKPDQLPNESDSTSSESWYQTTPDSRFNQNIDLTAGLSPLSEDFIRSSFKPIKKPDNWLETPMPKPEERPRVQYETTPDSRFDQNTDMTAGPSPLSEDFIRSSFKPIKKPDNWLETPMPKPEERPRVQYETTPDSIFDQNIDLTAGLSPLSEDFIRSRFKPIEQPDNWLETLKPKPEEQPNVQYETTPHSRFDQNPDLIPDFTPLSEDVSEQNTKPEARPSYDKRPESSHNTDTGKNYDQKPEFPLTRVWLPNLKPVLKPVYWHNSKPGYRHEKKPDQNSDLNPIEERETTPKYDKNISNLKPNPWDNTPPVGHEIVPEQSTDRPDTKPETWPSYDKLPESSHKTDPVENSDHKPEFPLTWVWLPNFKPILKPVYWHNSKPSYWHVKLADQNTDFNPDLSPGPCQDSNSRRPGSLCKTRPKYIHNHVNWCKTRQGHRLRPECSNKFRTLTRRPVYRPHRRGYIPSYKRRSYRPRYSKGHKHSWCISRRNRRPYPCWLKYRIRRWHHHRP